MICNNCKQRWADFPDTEFIIMGKLGIVPKTLDAALKRERAFASEDIALCPACKGELDKLPAPIEYVYGHIAEGK